MSTRWVTRVPDRASVDPRILALSAPDQNMLLVLEGRCKGRCYCRVSNEELRDAIGISRSGLAVMLRRMEEAGVIHRVVAGRKTERLGFVLRCRFDPERPTADDPASIRAATEALEAASSREGSRGSRRALQSGPCRALQSGPCRALQSAPSPIEESLSFEERFSEEGNSLEPRRRPQTADPVVEQPPPPRPEQPRPDVSRIPREEPSPSTPPPPPREDPAPPPVAADGLTEGQRAWLATLGPEQRARLDELPAKARTRLLEPHRAGVNPCPILAGVAARELAPRQAPPPPRVAATAAELVRLLPRDPDPALVPQCVGAIMLELEDKGLVSVRSIEKLCREVTAGIRPVESLTVPLEKTRAAAEKGTRFRSGPAAYWMTSVANYDRERLGGANTGRRVQV